MTACDSGYRNRLEADFTSTQGVRVGVSATLTSGCFKGNIYSVGMENKAWDGLGRNYHSPRI